MPNARGESDNIMDWLGDSVPFPPSFLDDPYNPGGINGYEWAWDNESQHPDTTAQEYVIDPLNSPRATPGAEPSAPAKPSNPPVPNELRPTPIPPRKRKSGDHDNRKKKKKSPGGPSSNDREGRWAEQLLNPCAAAVAEGNMERANHLLLVLNELASPSGDANHRLAFHGLRALTRHVSPPPPSSEPRLFQKSLIKFHEVSPWFAFPNAIANSAILQLLPATPAALHVVDIGVSHGVQWPTLLEALTRLPGGPPPLVRITSVSSSALPEASPFSAAPPGHDFSPRLLRFAESMNINLRIDRLDSLDSGPVRSDPGETLIVCVQFRLNGLGHDEQTELLKWIRRMRPSGVVLSESDAEGCGVDFGRRAEGLWRFLESTGAAFKGRECEERRLVEGEAARGLIGAGAVEREGWIGRMRGAGFLAEALGEDAVDGGRALLRKYDSNWEMRLHDDTDGSVGLCWKGCPVSFCSLWKLMSAG